MYQGAIVFVKVGLSVESLRQIGIKEVRPLGKEDRPIVMIRLPLEITVVHIGIQKNIVVQRDTQITWQPRDPGLYIGQPYFKSLN